MDYLTDRMTGERILAFGYNLDTKGRPVRDPIDFDRTGDHGSDPIGEDLHRMFPSGDIVHTDERNRRLAK